MTCAGIPVDRLKAVFDASFVLKRQVTTQQVLDACFQCQQLAPRVAVYDVAQSTMTRAQFDVLEDFLIERNATHATKIEVRNEAKLATYVRDGKTRTFAYHGFRLVATSDAPLDHADARALLWALVPLFAAREQGLLIICHFLATNQNE